MLRMSKLAKTSTIKFRPWRQVDLRNGARWHSRASRRLMPGFDC